MNIAVLYGAPRPDARPDELDDLAQVQAVRSALTDLGHESAAIGCTLDLAAIGRALDDLKPGLVFNLVESLGGIGRLVPVVPLLLEGRGVRFTGCPSEAIACTSNKPLAKRLLTAADLPTPRGFTPADLAHGVEVPPGRYIIKSSWEHASCGLDDDSIVEATDAAGLLAAIQRRSPSLGGDAFAETYIDGREINISLLASPPITSDHLPSRPSLLPPAEIRFADFPPGRARIVGYRAKWDDASFECTHTERSFEFAQADRPLLDEIGRLALNCWGVFHLRGYARVDFRIDAAGQPWILEVNANPCLSADAGFAATAARAGLSYTETIARILADA